MIVFLNTEWMSVQNCPEKLGDVWDQIIDNMTNKIDREYMKLVYYIGPEEEVEIDNNNDLLGAIRLALKQNLTTIKFVLKYDVKQLGKTGFIQQSEKDPQTLLWDGVNYDMW